MPSPASPTTVPGHVRPIRQTSPKHTKIPCIHARDSLDSSQSPWNAPPFHYADSRACGFIGEFNGPCNDIDFNNNGVFPEDQDVIDFFNVLAGGTCP